MEGTADSAPAARASDVDVLSWLAAIVESSDDAIIGKDLDGIITSWNPGAQRLYGYTAAEVIGRPIALLVPPDRTDELPSIMERLRHGQRIEQYETVRVRKDGALIDVSVSISPVKDAQGTIVGAASIARDITVRRRVEYEYAELLARERTARERAERAVDRTTRLQMVTEALARALTVAEVAQAVIERGLPGVGAAAGVVALLSDDASTVNMIGMLGYPSRLAEELRQVPVSGATPVAEAVRRGAPVWREAGDASDERHIDFTRRAPAYPSGAALPLVVDGRAMGAIGLSFHEPRTFSAEERAFMLALAGQCTQAIRRVQLFEHERAAREQLDAILGGVADGVVVQRPDGRFIYANDAAARMAGFDTAQEYLNASTFAISAKLTVLDASGRPFPYEQLPARRALRGEPAPEMVVQFRRDDTGEVRWSRTRSRTVRGVDGETLAISLFNDITNLVRARERLQFLAEAGAQIATSLDVDETLTSLVKVASTTLADWAVVILIDDDGSVQHIASAHRDPTREPFTRALHERHLRHASSATLLWRAIQTGETMLVPEVTDEMMASTEPDPERLELLRSLGINSLLYAPLTGRGRVQGAIALFMAESRRRFDDGDRAIAIEMARRAALAIENARLYREARDAVRARDEFLSIASHELRTPVTAISGVAQLAIRARRYGRLDDARLDRVLEQLARGSQRLVALTEDLLDVSRLQTGRFDLRPEPLDVHSFVADLVERYRGGLSEQHQIQLAMGAESCTIQADPARLEQVLANVLSNAVKYSPAGGTIRVVVACHDDGAHMQVQDPGIGLPAGTEETIFHAFGRAPNATHRQIQGLGLGLFICRQIVERHGGRIWAESPGDDRGTTFRIWLPLTPPNDSGVGVPGPS